MKNFNGEKFKNSMISSLGQHDSESNTWFYLQNLLALYLNVSDEKGIVKFDEIGNYVKTLKQDIFDKERLLEERASII